MGLVHRPVCTRVPPPTRDNTACIPAHHEVGIGDVVLDHASTQDDHPRALGEDGLCVDEPEVWERELSQATVGPSSPPPLLLWGLNILPSTMSRTRPGFL